MKGEFMKCTCTHLGGDPVCECIPQDNTCTTDQVIYYNATCHLNCAAQPGTCVVTGDPHYTTFDDTHHDFQGGKCRFTMVKTGDFEVVVSNSHRSNENNATVSWTDSIEIIYLGSSIKLDTSGKVHVNNDEVFLPYNKYYRVSQSFVAVTSAAESVVVKITEPVDNLALDLTWDGNSTVYATVHGQYYEATGGLCGLFDGNKANDMTTSDGKVTDDLSEFGWSWKYGDDDCEEEPQPEHPCTLFATPDWVPVIADRACDLLDSAPFTVCHGLVDVEVAKENCKYDVCACRDDSCACTGIKQYVKQCVDKGAEGLEGWRQTADFCPMTCEEPFQYEQCGSFCPATCADKNPTCDEGCNEGCFCPEDTFLQNGTCVTSEECSCQVNGTLVDEGHAWQDLNICKDCICRPHGEISCTTMQCKKCSKTEMPIKTEGSCCDECVEEWAWANNHQTTYKEVVFGSRQELRIKSVTRPYKFAWYFRATKDAEWVEISSEERKMTRYYLALDPVSSGDAGQYKWSGQKSNRSKDIIFTVTTSKFE